jgi:mannitol-1-/sugar-/sorbitol-6-phosphatase
VHYAAARVPVGIVSGAARAEIVPVLDAAGLAGTISVVVAADDVTHGKPHPEGYLRALELLGDGIGPRDVVAVEDTEAGVASARAAGLRVIARTSTLAPARLAAADELVDAIDEPLVRRLMEE